MSISLFSADELYNWLTTRQDFVLLDVRNDKDFNRFKVEGPYPFEMYNISYYDFMELEDESVAKIVRQRPIRVVCAKEGSAKYVAEILEKHGFEDVRYLEGGIKSWGNLLVPVLLNPDEDFQLYQFIRPGKASCSYGLCYKDEMATFDPSRNIEFYRQFAASKGCRLVRSFETHLQADYIAGSRLLQKTDDTEVMANKKDFKSAQFPYTPLVDNEFVGFTEGGPSVQVLFTPGHTPGSTSFLIDNRFLISGDTVFLQSVGRPDLGGMVDEWSNTLFATLKSIQQLDPNLLVLPAHYIDWGEASPQLDFTAKLSKAIQHNKHIYAIDNEQDFLAFIKSNMRDQPKEYATIRKINANIEQVDDDEAEILDLGKNECAASAYAAANA